MQMIKNRKCRAWDRDLEEMVYNDLSKIISRYDIIMLYSGLKDKNGQKIYRKDIIEFESDSDGIWRDVVTFEDGVFTVSILDAVQISNPQSWEREHDWVKSRSWGVTVGYGEMGTWNVYRAPITEMSGTRFNSSDEYIEKMEEYGHEARYINVEKLGNEFQHSKLLEGE